jgi:hypothetical protein
MGAPASSLRRLLGNICGICKGYGCNDEKVLCRHRLIPSSEIQSEVLHANYAVLLSCSGQQLLGADFSEHLCESFCFIGRKNIKLLGLDIGFLHFC